MKNRITFTTAFVLAAAFLPGSMHASAGKSLAETSLASSAMLFGTDFGVVNAIATGTPQATAKPFFCPINDPASCGVGGFGGCTNSPENPTVLLGVLGVSGLLVGRKGRSLLQKRRTVTATA